MAGSKKRIKQYVMKIKESTQGYVIIDTKDNQRIVLFTYRLSKRQCIQDFIKGSGETWEYWRDKWKFKCVNANQTIKLNL